MICFKYLLKSLVPLAVCGLVTACGSGAGTGENAGGTPSDSDDSENVCVAGQSDCDFEDSDSE